MTFGNKASLMRAATNDWDKVCQHFIEPLG